MSQKVLLSWSGGKDSALALYECTKTGSYDIAALLTTITEDYDRISLHGVRRVLLEEQSRSLNIPLEIVFITKNAANEEYESKMRAVLERYQTAGVSSVVFGDLFLEEVRKYREENLEKIGMEGIFPLWARDTRECARTFIEAGFKASVICVDSCVLDKTFVGRDFDRSFLSDLPSTVDPCGENGEFHSFVYDGPLFREKIEHTKGEVVLRENRFYFCDLIP